LHCDVSCSGAFRLYSGFAFIGMIVFALWCVVFRCVLVVQWLCLYWNDSVCTVMCCVQVRSGCTVALPLLEW